MQGTKIPLKEVQKIKTISPARVVPELTQQIIDFASDQSYAHWDEYQEKLLRDSGSMLEEVIEWRKFGHNVSGYLHHCQNKGIPVNSEEILKRMPSGE